MIKVTTQENEVLDFETSEDFKTWFISRMDAGEIKNGGYEGMDADDILDAELNTNTANFTILISHD